MFEHTFDRPLHKRYIKNLTILHEHANFALPLARAKRAYYFPLTRIEETMPKKKSLNVYHLSATENTLRKMPKFNPYQTGHGVIGDTKYNRRKTKRELRKLIDES